MLNLSETSNVQTSCCLLKTRWPSKPQPYAQQDSVQQLTWKKAVGPSFWRVPINSIMKAYVLNSAALGAGWPCSRAVSYMAVREMSVCRQKQGKFDVPVFQVEGCGQAECCNAQPV